MNILILIVLDVLCTTCILLPNLNLISLYGSCDKHSFISRIKNTVDPDQLASKKPADLDLQYFKNSES